MKPIHDLPIAPPSTISNDEASPTSEGSSRPPDTRSTKNSIDKRTRSKPGQRRNTPEIIIETGRKVIETGREVIETGREVIETGREAKDKEYLVPVNNESLKESSFPSSAVDSGESAVWVSPDADEDSSMLDSRHISSLVVKPGSPLRQSMPRNTPLATTAPTSQSAQTAARTPVSISSLSPVCIGPTIPPALSQESLRVDVGRDDIPSSDYFDISERSGMSNVDHGQAIDFEIIESAADRVRRPNIAKHQAYRGRVVDALAQGLVKREVMVNSDRLAIFESGQARGREELRNDARITGSEDRSAEKETSPQMKISTEDAMQTSTQAVNVLPMITRNSKSQTDIIERELLLSQMRREIPSLERRIRKKQTRNSKSQTDIIERERLLLAQLAQMRREQPRLERREREERTVDSDQYKLTNADLSVENLGALHDHMYAPMRKEGSVSTLPLGSDNSSLVDKFSRPGGSKALDLHYHETDSADPRVFDDQDDDNASTASSYPTSIFSVQSLETSASEMSRSSDYALHQIATATKELVRILGSDEVLLPLYKSAIEDPSVGAEKLQRNLERMLKLFAEHLKGKAKDRLEFLAAQLVTSKARFLAEAIVQQHDSGTVLQQKAREASHESSDDEDGNRSVEESSFEDLVVLREILVGSNAFLKLRAQVQNFVRHRTTPAAMRENITRSETIPGSAIGVEPSKEMKPVPVEGWYGQLRRRINSLLVASGQLEPPTQPGEVRLRFQCRCGETFTSDVVEYKQGGIADLVTRIQCATGKKVVSRPYDSNNSNQKYVVQRPALWLRNAVTKVVTAFTGSSKQVHLPQHSSSSTTACATSGSTTQQEILLLLACMHNGRFQKKLTQDRIENIATDRKLFQFLRLQYTQHRRRFSTLLSLKAVKGIFFIKFRLPMGGSVEVRHHNPCCIPSSCECLPPKDRVEPSTQAEYRCIPGPPTVWPPIDSSYLSHLFTSPSCINENDTWIIDQIPKRICGEVQGKQGKPAEAWGIFYDEGLDQDIIALVTFVVLFLGSLVFGVLWSMFKMDVQGAFGVSAYVVAACGVFITVISTRTEKA